MILEKDGRNIDKSFSSSSLSSSSSSMPAYPEIPEVHKKYDAKLEEFSSQLSVITNKIILTDKQIEDSTEYLIPYYYKGTRHKFAFGFSGLSYKEDIDEGSAAKILENVCKRTNDPEIDARLDTLHRTYVNGSKNGSEAITESQRRKQHQLHDVNIDRLYHKGICWYQKVKAAIKRPQTL
jgi:hypothetical protein